MQSSSNENKINFLVLKHLEQYADRLPSLEKLRQEIEKLHLLGDSVDLDDNIRPTTYEDMNNTYGEVSPLQLTSIVEKGINQLQSSELYSKEDIDILRPLTTGTELPTNLKQFYNSIEACLVDYCKLIKERIDIQRTIQLYTENGDEMEQISCTQVVDVPLQIPPGKGMGLVLSPTEKGILVKGFSKGESIARNSGMIVVGDMLIAINGNEIKTIADAKQNLEQSNTPVISFSRQAIINQSKCEKAKTQLASMEARIQLIEKSLTCYYSVHPSSDSVLAKLQTQRIGLDTMNFPPELLLKRLKSLCVLSGHYNSPIYGMALDKTERYLFTGADDQLIKIWDVQTGCLLQTMRGHRSKITDLVINDNNSVLMSSSEDGWIMFWDITPLSCHSFPYYRIISCVCLHRRFVCQLKYDSINQLLYSVADDGFIHAWNIPLLDPLNPNSGKNLTENQLCVFSLNHGKYSVGDNAAQMDNSVLFCDITPDARFLASGTRSGSVFIWRIPIITRNENGFAQRLNDIQTRSMLTQVLHGHEKGVDSVMFAHNGHDLVTASEAEGNACIWRCSSDFTTCEKLILHCDINFSKCRSKVKLSNCVWSADDSSVITSSWLKRVEKKITTFEVDIKIWNAKTGCIEFILNRGEHQSITGPISNIAFHPEYPHVLITSCWGGKLCFWDLNKQLLIKELENKHLAGHSNRYFLNDPVPVLDFRVNTSMYHIYTVDDDGNLTIYGTESPKAYCYAPMTQYFVHDYDPLNEQFRIPIDKTTNQLAELMPTGPLLDYLRAPYQYQQLNETLGNKQVLQLREQEVMKDHKRMEEIAKQERLMHDQNEQALRETANQDMLDDIEDPEPAEEGDNDEFNLVVSESESDDNDDDDGLYEDEVPIVSGRRVIASESDSEVSHTTRQSRQSQTDIYSRQYRPNPRRERRERNDIIIASEDDLSVNDDEEDFELDDDVGDVVLEDEDDLSEEEEEEEEMDLSDDSDTPAPQPKQRPKSKPAPKSKPKKKEEIQPLVDFSKIQRKKRIFTQEQLDISFVPKSVPHCRLCGKKEEEVEGGFISKWPVIYKDERYFVHKACVLCSMDAARSSHCFYNICKSIHAGKKVRCRACGQYGVTFWCQVSGCINRYHYTCAKELGLLQPVLEHEPFVTQNELFLCPEHRSFENDFFLKAMPTVSLQFDSEWLRQSKPTHSFFPQLKDTVVYFPQGHLQHILHFGDPDLPFTAFPCCCCQIEKAGYQFPRHAVPSSSIEYRLTLRVIGIPTKQYQLADTFIDSFTPVNESISFNITLRHSDLPDYIINYATYTSLLQKKWKVDDHFEMEFMEDNGDIRKFGGKILRLRNDCYWRGSPWEAADILWDGNDGLQTISMFETLTADPIALYPSIPESVVQEIKTVIETIQDKDFAQSFIIPVPSDTPDLVFYDAIVPVKMELELILRRLSNNFYHSVDAVLLDIDTIVTNCQLYNEAGSSLVNDVLQLREELVNAISAISISPSTIHFEEESPSTIQPVIESIWEKLLTLFTPIQPLLEKPLPPYLITYCSKLENCPRPMQWNDLLLKKKLHYYSTLTILYYDCRMLLQTVMGMQGEQDQFKSILTDLDALFKQTAEDNQLQVDIDGFGKVYEPLQLVDFMPKQVLEELQKEELKIRIPIPPKKKPVEKKPVEVEDDDDFEDESFDSESEDYDDKVSQKREYSESEDYEERISQKRDYSESSEESEEFTKRSR